eukprot:m.679844 g.679844  ORF g.679844 m.679844 type:complete len:237 (+) comp58585_c0_seq34:90-800(+)
MLSVETAVDTRVLMIDGAVCSLDITIAPELLQVLLACPRLCDLDISHNSLGDEVSVVVAEALKQMPGLVFLTINGNGIELSGARALAASLETCTTLRQVYCAYNKFCEEDIVAVLNSLRGCREMSVFDFDGNTLGPAGARALAKCVAGWADLRVFEFSATKLEEADFLAVLDGLAQHTQLQGFSLSATSTTVSKACRDQLISVLQRQPCLTVLALGGTLLMETVVLCLLWPLLMQR